MSEHRLVPTINYMDKVLVPKEPTEEEFEIMAKALRGNTEARKAFVWLWNGADAEWLQSGFFRRFIRACHEAVLLCAAPASEPTDSRERARNVAAERRKTQRRNTSKPDTPELMRRVNCGDRRQSNVAAQEPVAKRLVEPPSVSNPVSAAPATPSKLLLSKSDILPYRQNALDRIAAYSERSSAEFTAGKNAAKTDLKVCDQALLAISQEQRIAELEQNSQQLLAFADHKPNCAVVVDPDLFCDCGFAESDRCVGSLRGRTESEEEIMNDAARGIYKKYRVYRENDPRGKHNDCDYFVLDLVHDKFAWPALVAYASSCQAEYPELAKDLWSEIGTRAPTGKDKARNPVVELERELSVSQAELAKAQEQLVIIDDSFERLTQMNLSNIDKLDEANEQLAHYAEVSNGLPEEPYHSNDCPYEKSCGKAAATDCTCDLPDRKARYDKEIRDPAIALAALVRDLREQYSDTLLRLEKAQAERDAAVRDAERYQKLRAHCRVTAAARNGYPEHAALVYYHGLHAPKDMTTYTAEGLDVAVDRLPSPKEYVIDAAIKAEGSGHD